jgi:hypothetical protein
MVYLVGMIMGHSELSTEPNTTRDMDTENDTIATALTWDTISHCRQAASGLGPSRILPPTNAGSSFGLRDDNPFVPRQNRTSEETSSPNLGTDHCGCEDLEDCVWHASFRRTLSDSVTRVRFFHGLCFSSCRIDHLPLDPG